MSNAEGLNACPFCNVRFLTRQGYWQHVAHSRKCRRRSENRLGKDQYLAIRIEQLDQMKVEYYATKGKGWNKGHLDRKITA